MSKRRKKFKDKINAYDFFQVLGGAILGTILVLFAAKNAPPNYESGIILLFFVIIALTLALLGIMKGIYPKRLLLFLLIAAVVAYPFSSFMGIIIGDITYAQLWTTEYFTSITFVAFLIGMSTGAIADAAKD